MTPESRHFTIFVTWLKKSILKNVDVSKNMAFMKIKVILLNSIFNYLSNEGSTVLIGHLVQKLFFFLFLSKNDDVITMFFKNC